MKSHIIKAFVHRGETQYVAECVDIPVVTQGRTIDETLENLKEAVSLHLEGEDMEELGFVDNPGILVTFEIEALRHVA